MKIIVDKNAGFCFGVKNAIELATKYAKNGAYMIGEIIHNKCVVDNLKSRGLQVVNDVSELPDCGVGKEVVIRSHGAPKRIYDILNDRGYKIIDATCPFVKRIHDYVHEHYERGYTIAVIGKADHPEVTATVGWCDGKAIIIDSEDDVKKLISHEKVCVVVQTTYSMAKYLIIKEKIFQMCLKSVEIFDTICYTTKERQESAAVLAKNNDAVIVIGDKSSSNSVKLFEICKGINPRTCFVNCAEELKNHNFFGSCKTVGIVAGASTPPESIMEVKTYMGKEFGKVSDEEFINAVNETPKSTTNYRAGKIVTGKVISADEKGVQVSLDGKIDGFITPDEACYEGEYNPQAFASIGEIEVYIINNKPEDGVIPLSRKRVEEIRINDKEVDKVRDGSVEFEVEIKQPTKGGLIGKLGSYKVFIPASQIKLKYVSNLENFTGKMLKVRAIDVDDEKREIIASHRVLLEEEQKVREEKEKIFWENVKPDVVVAGEVKRINDYGAFVSVDGIDCLAHKEHLSYGRIDSPAEILEIGKTYDFLVLKTDPEKRRVSLGYKELQPHPFELCMQNHPVGTVVEGKVISVLPYGAFVEIEPGVEGLVHVSEASASYVKNIEEVLHKDDVVTVKILKYDPENRKTTLSIKACLPEEEQQAAAASSEKPRSERKPRTRKESDGDSYTDDTTNNPFADLLKDIDKK